ncbi:MAG: hypothetical protein JSV24_09160 [Bacteroidales bacterium]|nr:MAG: hypothetical protein JSV24_09160 [Bacteroidales bacterium]
MNRQFHRIPFFPLGLSIFPGEKAPLRIFESRYRQLITECRESGMTFGIPFISDSRILGIGTEVMLNEVLDVSPEGEMIIIIEGLKIFRVTDYIRILPGKLYGGGEIEYLETDDYSVNRRLINLVISLDLITGTSGSKPGYTDNINMIEVAKSLNLGSRDKYRFLRLIRPDLKERFLIKQLEYRHLLRKQEELLKKNFVLN